MENQQDSRSLRDYVATLRRRAWMIAFVAIVTTCSAVLFSTRQDAVYQATAKVLVTNQSLVVTQSGITSSLNTQTADRELQTEALFAQTTDVLEEATRHTHRVTPSLLAAESSVTPDTNADRLEFSVRDHDPLMARRLANYYANAYVRKRRDHDRATFKIAIKNVTTQLGATPTPDRPVRDALQAQLLQLQTGWALVSNNASIANLATDAPKVRPTPVKTGIIGGILGLILGVGLAFLSNALDTRIRSADALAESLGLPLLARISAPPRSLQRSNELAMMSMAPDVHAESYRKLRTSFDFANLRHQAQSVMITSALPQEGKSTTIANLAVAFARSGRRVALVDLDLRRPIIASFFDVEGRVGVTDVVLGTVSLDDALVSVALEQQGFDASRVTRELGALDVLPAGTIPPDPAEFVGSPGLAETLAALRERVDLVLIDAPPVLAVSDAMTLSGRVDALIVVARASAVRRPMITELRRQLATAPCVKLGFIFTNAEADAEYGYESQYGYGYGRTYQSPASSPTTAERTT